MRLRTLRSAETGNTDEVVLAILRQSGPQTLETLSVATGIEWEQTFAIVDRLSRSGSVSLRHDRPCEYHVSIGRSVL